MPVIRIDMLAGRTHEQKSEIAKVFTAELARIAKCTEDDVQIVFSEYERSNWSKSGAMLDARAPTVIAREKALSGE
ncbi:tautomerase family protein (plasmid) [Rhizobium sp. CB3090]|uniref:tautomerase family protein n=1 Tax=Rhizobium sp. CB3090 TaxID=3039156 RepID=UPI0024B1F92F|nr:tautomerase family protein [Rhizobium sp. CB3090]WFU11768.1 tautomerase family protein [Rhizobium sp. CB3090]